MIAFTIYGEPASKANSRELATVGPKDARRTIFRKSEKALNYEREALRQIPPAARQQLQGPVAVTMRIFYATERPDLDESLILDILQDRFKTTTIGETKRRDLVQRGVYCNDRQVREKHIFHAIDRLRPRTEIEVRPVQASLLEAAASAPAPAVAIPQGLPF